jgi:hypothetical protein
MVLLEVYSTHTKMYNYELFVIMVYFNNNNFITEIKIKHNGLKLNYFCLNEIDTKIIPDITFYITYEICKYNNSYIVSI